MNTFLILVVLWAIGRSAEWNKFLNAFPLWLYALIVISALSPTAGFGFALCVGLFFGLRCLCRGLGKALDVATSDEALRRVLGPPGPCQTVRNFRAINASFKRRFGIELM